MALVPVPVLDAEELEEEHSKRKDLKNARKQERKKEKRKKNLQYPPRLRWD